MTKERAHRTDSMREILRCRPPYKEDRKTASAATGVGLCATGNRKGYFLEPAIGHEILPPK